MSQYSRHAFDTDSDSDTELTPIYIDDRYSSMVSNDSRAGLLRRGGDLERDAESEKTREEKEEELRNHSFSKSRDKMRETVADATLESSSCVDSQYDTVETTSIFSVGRKKAINSPYPEVRAAVPATDDPLMPQNTPRMWVIGIFLVTICSGLNILFTLHWPAFVISSFFAAMVAWPLGRIWDQFVPNWRIPLTNIYLNNSPFNIKEHCLIIVMANVSYGTGVSYVPVIVLTMKHRYNNTYFGWGFSIVSSICVQCLGYGMAGICRRILVYPASLIWPSNLVTTTFLTNIHMNVNHTADGWKISRLRFFLIVFSAYFVWNWLPGYLAPFLSNFAFVTYAAPDNVIVNQIFGSSSGLGLIPINFDWNVIAGYIGSPLVPPFFSIGNVAAGVVVIFWIITPILHYSNAWYGRYLPMSDSNSYDRFQRTYDAERVLKPLVKGGKKKFELDVEKYKEYSPLYLSTTFALSYGVSFAAITSTVVHTILFHGKEIMYYWKHSRKEPEDVHMELMRKYPEVPEWWYALVLAICFALACVTVSVWETDLPIWALIIALLIAGGLLIPAGMIAALTNVTMGLNVLTEFVVGYILPGRPVGMMFFKTFGYISNAQALNFLVDLKLGHYLKLAPRVMFCAQILATTWGSICQLAVVEWAQMAIPDLCEESQKTNFSCPQVQVFYSASVIWGLVGPGRIFGEGQLYHGLLWMFLVGAALPFFSWLWLKRHPNSRLKFIHWPVFFNGPSQIPPATPYNYASWCVVGYIFNWLIKRRWFNWWAKYNYTLSAGLDVGMAVSAAVIFVSLQLPNINPPSWWGTNIFKPTMDIQGNAFQEVLKEGESFGMKTWK